MLGWQSQNVIGHPCAMAQVKVHLLAPQRSPTRQQRQETRRAEELPHLRGPVQLIGICNRVGFSCLSCFIVYVSSPVSSPLLWERKKSEGKKVEGAENRNALALPEE